MEKLKIAVADCGKYANYEKWIKSFSSDIEVVCLSRRPDNFSEIADCKGYLLTGGEDVHPRFYNMPELLPLCNPNDMDEERDEFELRVLNYVRDEKMPLLGICRGMQLANVFYGGTMIADLPTEGYFNHSKYEEGRDRYHQIMIDINSWFYKMTGMQEARVNSAHHQAVGKVAPQLVVSALSTDGVIEVVEWKKPEEHPFMMLVQWHPERMDDQSSPMVKNVGDAFIAACRNYK